MGQIFKATVYDIDSRQCYSSDVDKFHANCYSFSGDICAAHFLLRQAAYRVIWCGDYIGIDDNIKDFLSEEQLLGISVNKNLRSFQNSDDQDLSDHPHYEQIKFINDNHNSWNQIENVWDEAISYFDFKNTLTVKYEGYLVNHSKKLAINLKDYYEQSASLTRKDEEYAIDLIPPLTETGGGTIMALFDGCSADVSEKLIGNWCGDLLQIVDTLPDDYKEIYCCFAAIWEKADYCYSKFGLDNEQFILKNKNGDRFEGVPLSISLKRGMKCNLKCEKRENKIIYRSITIE